MTTIKLLQNRNLYHYDPIAYFLFGKLRISPATFGLLSLVILTGLYLFTAWIC